MKIVYGPENGCHDRYKKVIKNAGKFNLTRTMKIREIMKE